MRGRAIGRTTSANVAYTQAFWQAASGIELERIRRQAQRLAPILDARDGARNEVLLAALHLLVQVGRVVRGTNARLVGQI